MWRIAVGCLTFCVLAAAHIALADDVDVQIAAILSVGPLGKGSPAAEAACKDLSRRGPEILPRLLSAMDASNIVAANWYRAAYERIVARELAKSQPNLPIAEFKAFVREPRHAGRARRLALALLDRVEPAFGTALVPTLIDDPEFREDAVAAALKQGDDAKGRGDVAGAKRAYAIAFDHARSSEQVTAAARKLEGIGEKVSIVEHLGFLTDWSVVGPFPAPGMSGFRTPFPPERGVDLDASLTTAVKTTLHWTRRTTNDPLGTVDLVRALGPESEVVGYAYTEFESPTGRDAQLRCSADDCLAVWLNGEKVFGREMWLNGTRLDRFITPVHLVAGRNRVLVKICQGPHHRDPSVGNAWTFQLRFCAADGAGLGLKSLPATHHQTSAAR